MSLSLFLTNYFFWSISCLLLIPLLRKVNFLIYKNGIPLFFIIIFIIIKPFFICEFPFTKTIPSKFILPSIKCIYNLKVYNLISILHILILLWISISLFLIVSCLYKYIRLKKFFLIIEKSNDLEIKKIINEINKKNNKSNNIPKIIKTDFCETPFIFGWKKPIIVVPKNLSDTDLRFSILHEFQHYKYNHVLIKICIEILLKIYWWNPIIVILKNEIIKALEVQADIYAMENLSKEECRLYLNTLINLTKKSLEYHENSFSLSFYNKKTIIENRIFKILNNFNENENKHFFDNIYLSILVAFFMIPFFLTFEVYHSNSIKTENTFIVNRNTSYFVLKSKGMYDLYIDNQFITTMNFIPEDLSNIPVILKNQ